MRAILKYLFLLS